MHKKAFGLVRTRNKMNLVSRASFICHDIELVLGPFKIPIIFTLLISVDSGWPNDHLDINNSESNYSKLNSYKYENI